MVASVEQLVATLREGHHSNPRRVAFKIYAMLHRPHLQALAGTSPVLCAKRQVFQGPSTLRLHQALAQRTASVCAGLVRRRKPGPGTTTNASVPRAKVIRWPSVPSPTCGCGSSLPYGASKKESYQTTIFETARKSSVFQFLQESNLIGSNQHIVDLQGANLGGADLHTAKVTTEQLDTVKSLENAIMPDGSIHR